MNRCLLLCLVLAASPLHAAIAELERATGVVTGGSFVGTAFELAKDFQLELLYESDSSSAGQIVPLTWDDKGRLIVASYSSDRIARLTIPRVGSADPVRTEMLSTDFGSAEGLAASGRALYVNINRSNTRAHGLYRLVDTNGDDQYDAVNVLRVIRGTGDHGTHAVKLAPDGKSLFLTSGNATPPTDFQSHRLDDRLLGEDNLVPRIYTGFMDTTFAPDGWIANFDPDGKNWSLYAAGLRNTVDLAFNKDGEMFTYDSDMEWDMGAPWYRPTEIHHIVSGGDYGFRNSSRKHPGYYLDNVGPIALVGSGSPVGTAFGTGTKFPARFQDSLFAADWSYGNVWAVNIQPEGASYTGSVTPFVSGRPFAVSGLTVNRADGSLLIATTGSQLFRVTYTGTESTAPTAPDKVFAADRDRRHALESFHGRQDPAAVDAAWNALLDEDRAIRYAARVALEWQDQSQWRQRALDERNPHRAIPAIAALARVNGKDDFTRLATTPPPDKALQAQMMATLDRIDWAPLPYSEKLDLLRAYGLTFIRLGKPDDATRQRLIAKLDPLLPADGRELNWELSEMLVYLEAPSAAAKVMALLRQAPGKPVLRMSLQEYANPQLRVRNSPGLTGAPGASEASLLKQEDQIQYAQLLRTLRSGWTPALRSEYFEWLQAAPGFYRGGNSFGNALATIRMDAFSLLSPEERDLVPAIAAAMPAAAGGARGAATNARGIPTPGLANPLPPGALASMSANHPGALSDSELTIVARLNETESNGVTAARIDLTRATFAERRNQPAIERAVQNLAEADLKYALAQATLVEELKKEFSDPARFAAALQAFRIPGNAASRGGPPAAPARATGARNPFP